MRVELSKWWEVRGLVEFTALLHSRWVVEGIRSIGWTVLRVSGEWIFVGV